MVLATSLATALPRASWPRAFEAWYVSDDKHTTGFLEKIEDGGIWAGAGKLTNEKHSQGFK